MQERKRRGVSVSFFVLLLAMLVSSVIFSGGVLAFKDSDENKIGDSLEEKFNETPAGEKVRLIIKLDKLRNNSIEEIENSSGEKVRKRLEIVNAVSIDVPEEAARNIAERPFVERVEADYEVETVLDYSTEQINVSGVWAENLTGSGVDVSVVDTGVYSEHDALSDDLEKERDFTDSGTTNDNHGHGTHVAGIVSSGDSTYRGVAYDSDLYNAKVLTSDGSGYASDVIDGIEWSVSEGAEIVSLSLGAKVDTCDGTDVLSEAVDNAVSEGVVAVVAAGNEGPDSYTITSPGCSEKGITIGAVDSNDNVADFSSRGPTDDERVKPDVVAPGVSITSSWNDGSFQSLSGTSMATPHVSGIAALLMEADSSLSPSEIKSQLKETALDIGEDENTQGAGRVRAYEAVEEYLSPKISVSDFSTSEKEIYINETLNVSLSVSNTGTETAEDVTAVLSLPDGLITNDSLETSFGELNSGEEVSEKWLVEGKEKGNFSIDVFVNSSNAGSDSDSVSLIVLGNETEDNETGEPIRDNKTGENGTRRDCDWLPPGLRDKKTLPQRWQGECPEAGAKPGSIGHGLERAGEALRMAFTFNEQKKAEYRMELAKKRLAEAGELVKEGKEEEAEKAFERYEKELEKVNEFVEKNGSRTREERDFSKFTSEVAEESSFHEDVLKELAESSEMPEQSKQGLNRALEASNKSFKNALDSLNKSDPEKAAAVRYNITERRLNQVKNKITERKKQKEEGSRNETEDKDDKELEKRSEQLEEKVKDLKKKAEEEREKAEEKRQEAKEEYQNESEDKAPEEVNETREKTQEGEYKSDEEAEQTEDGSESQAGQGEEVDSVGSDGPESQANPGGDTDDSSKISGEAQGNSGIGNEMTGKTIFSRIKNIFT